MRIEEQDGLIRAEIRLNLLNKADKELAKIQSLESFQVTERHYHKGKFHTYLEVYKNLLDDSPLF